MSRGEIISYVFTNGYEYDDRPSYITTRGFCGDCKFLFVGVYVCNGLTSYEDCVSNYASGSQDVIYISRVVISYF